MEFTKTLLESLDHLGAWGVLTTDTDLRIIGWNRWLERQSGRPATEMLGRHLFEAFPDLVTRSLDRYYKEALEGQAAMLSQRFHKYLLPLPPTTPNPTLAHMQQTVRIAPVSKEGQILGTLTLIEDVTERVVTEDELRQQAQRLEEANRQKDEFLAMLAHELRNPLAPIRNGIRVLDIVPSESEEAQQTREMLERQVSHLARLVDDLLDVSRIVRGKVRLQLKPCDLIEVVRQVADDYRSILRDNRLALQVDLPPHECWIEGDAIRLAQIVSNLLQNANKFTNPGGEVRLEVQIAEGKEAVVTITDTGIGMSAETLARIFDAFSQAENSLDRSKGGLGLGLALVKGLVELHSGSVEAASPGIGQGSSFTIRLPVKEIAPAAAPSPQLPGQRRGRIRRVLVIEDNRDTAITLKALLGHLGLDVELAYSGVEGLETARRHCPDAVLCDIGLPELDGFAVARALRSDSATQDVFLIAQSGYGHAEHLRKAREAGFDLHLVKPVAFMELARILDCANGL